mmetsp:Transcript_29095/g.76322  ORF Transcript_29095/g.76322 Transcript_29095/m.76322 type:complete len:124 (-) Transcript_29095:33-404(-)
MEGAVLAVGIFGSGGTLKLSLPDITLKLPAAQDLQVLKLDISAKASVPDQTDSVLFLEFRPVTVTKQGKQVGPPKYWTCSPLADWTPGLLQLQLYKAPPVYALSSQRNQPKMGSFLKLLIHDS